MWPDSKVFNEEKEIKYNNEGYFVKNKGFFPKKYKVTLITPVYNAAPFLEKTIDSVISQSIGFENIEYILVDDKSTDSSREILWAYANKYKNIKVVFLQENTGSPATPRNLGIELAKADYVIFLDSDDWLEQTGLKALYDLAQETDDNYVVGRTIKVANAKNTIVGEHQSIVERRSVSPYSIPHIFQHLGPTARMMKRSLLIDNKIRFPHMKFAEDKQFFIDVLTHSPTISTTKQVIYYANRLDENESSLTTKTSVMEKTDTNVQVIKYVKSKKLPVEQEKMILNRLYEFDCITRLFDRQHFLKSENKEEYFAKFQEALDTSKDLGYEISENFFHPINKVIYQLFLKGEYKQMEDLIRWNKKAKLKQYIIKDSLPYMITPFREAGLEHIRVSMLAVYNKGYFEEDKYKLEVQVFGDDVDKIEELAFRSRKDVNDEYIFDFNVTSNVNGISLIDIETLNKLPSTSYEVFIRYDVYRKISLLRPEQIQYENRIFNFYTTINSNLGFKISK